MKNIVFGGSASRALSENIAQSMGIQLGKINQFSFSDGEVSVELLENVRGSHAFVIQSITPPKVSDNLMELLFTVDALKRSSASYITAIIPYFGYTRQDRRPGTKRVPISAKVVAKMLENIGVNHIITMDLHADQIQGFFNIPLDNIYASPLVIEDIKKLNLDIDKITVVAPDIGGVARSRAIAKRIKSKLAVIDKRRYAPNMTEITNLIGDIEGQHCILVDDILDTGGTMANAASALKNKGARSVRAYAVHPVLSGKAIENIEKSEFDEVVVSDTIELSEKAKACKRIRQFTVCNLLSDIISRVQKEDSVSHIFQDLYD